MKRPKIYGAMVNAFPVSQKSKSWFIRNWIGGLLGALWGGVTSYIFIGEVQNFWNLFRIIILFPAFLSRKIIDLFGGLEHGLGGAIQISIIGVPLGLIIGFIIGSFIQSIIRRR